MANSFYQLDLAATKELAKQLKKMGDDVIKASAGSLYRSAHKVMAVSQEVYVPVDTGALRASGNVGLPETTAKGDVMVPLGYGNSSVDYAQIVHETDRNYNHGKQWKYLQTPLMDAIEDIERGLVADINRVIG